MYNFKNIKGTFKGLAGECLFTAAKKVYITRFIPLKFILRKYADTLKENQKNFLANNWLSFYAIEFGNKITIYEVKTRNIEYYYRNKLCTTQNTLNILYKAKELGFIVKFAVILLKDNWNYSVKFKSIENIQKKLWVDEHSNYNKDKYS